MRKDHDWAVTWEKGKGKWHMFDMCKKIRQGKFVRNLQVRSKNPSELSFG